MLRSIGGRRIGPDAPAFVIAEIGLNHGGSLDRALEMVDAAAWAGASAVKLQSLVADRLVSHECPAPAHVSASSLRAFFQQFELTFEAQRAVVERARERGLAVLTTPLAEDAMPALAQLGFDAYKIASGDLTYHGLLSAVARTGQPMIVSTGMSAIPEIAAALGAARQHGCDCIALLHCVSAYPTPVDAQNLRAIATLIETFRVPTGLSDHGNGLISAVAAVALGACIYERHLVLDHDEDAIDRAVSSTPSELRAIVRAMEEARLALGTGEKVCQPAEAPNLRASRRGLYAVRRLQAGHVLAREDVVALRPSTDVPPSQLDALVGSVLSRDMAPGDPFSAGDVTGALASAHVRSAS